MHTVKTGRIFVVASVTTLVISFDATQTNHTVLTLIKDLIITSARFPGSSVSSFANADVGTLGIVTYCVNIT